MNKNRLFSLLCMNLLLAPALIGSTEAELNLDELNFDFTEMPNQAPVFDTSSNPEKSNLELLEGVGTVLSKMSLEQIYHLTHNKVIDPMDESLAKSPQLLFLASLGIYGAGSMLELSGFKKIIYAVFPYLLLRSLLKRTVLNKPA